MGITAPESQVAGEICVFTPAPLVTVAIEPSVEQSPEIHIHAGGQGFWVARMASLLGAGVTLCCALGGESGVVLRSLIADAGITLKAVEVECPNGAYVLDRRGGSREIVAEEPGGSLVRHAVDALYGRTLAASLNARVTLLTGTANERTLSPEIYGRLARDLRSNGATVLADLSGVPLAHALDAGVDLIALSVEELMDHGVASSAETGEVLEGVERLRAAGAANVVVTRAAESTLARLDGRLVELTPPRFEPMEHRGAGDSLFAAIGVALAEGAAIEEAVRFGMAAGSLNVTRRGLGTGQREAIEDLIHQIDTRVLEA